MIFVNCGGHLRQAMSFNLKERYFAHIVAKKIKLKTKHSREKLRSLNKKSMQDFKKSSSLYRYLALTFVFAET